jgi:hypothetical protein
MNTKMILGVIIAITLGATVWVTPVLEQVQALVLPANSNRSDRNAPPAITGDNIYAAWWTNNTGNDEVMFRASNDKGQTFGDKINLSNTTDSESTRVEIDSDDDSIVVTWWETNETSETPVMKVSNDFGRTFGPMLKLASNGTIASGEVEPIL